jgi:hypothetical protein
MFPSPTCFIYSSLSITATFLLPSFLQYIFVAAIERSLEFFFFFNFDHGEYCCNFFYLENESIGLTYYFLFKQLRT